MQPIFAYTDASFAGGHNTSKEWSAAAKNAGYTKICVIDDDSAGAIIQAKKTTKQDGIGFLAGATLTVYHPERDSQLWHRRFEKHIEEICALLNVDTPDPTQSFPVFNSLKHLIAKLGGGRIAIDKINGLKPALSKLLGVDVGRFNHLEHEIIKNLSQLLKKINSVPVHGHVICIAQTQSQYQSLLRLVSHKGINKHHNLNHENDIDKIIAVPLSDVIAAAKDGLLLVDPATENSVIGGLIANNQTASITTLLTEYLENIVVGVSSSNYVALRNTLVSLNRPVVPFPYARFIHKKEYEEYQVKVAVHLKSKDLDEAGNGGNAKAIIYDHGFPSPDPTLYLKPMQQWIEDTLGEDLSLFPEIEWDFWSNVEDTSISLGQVHLPNYDMPIMDVVRYAAMSKRVDAPTFTHDDEAKSWFSEWVTPDCPEGVSLYDFVQRKLNDFCLHMIASEGLKKRLEAHLVIDEEKIKTYQERFDMEFSVIENMGFSGYFLIVYDVVNHARKIGVPVGDGRGSAAGSLIVYSLEITDVDPEEYELQFERFLNPERVSMPDIDVDFGDGIGVDRNTLLRYINEKYQQKGTIYPSSSQIANVNKYQLKAALSAVRSALGLSMRYDNYLKMLVKQVETALGIKGTLSVSWDDFLAHEIIKSKLKKEPVLAKVVRFAQNLSGKRSTYGVHAGGVVISPTVITDYSAIECDDKGKFFSQFDKDDIESAGLIKFDFLGLRTLSIIEEVVRLIAETEHINIDHRQLPKDERDVMELVCQQKLADIFQLESSGMRDLVGRLQPKNIGEIGVLSALFRPGALDSGMVEDFVEVKFGRKPAHYEHPALRSVTEATYGCIVYQEQVMSIVRELAGYSLGEADLLRRAMGKKKAEEMQKQKSVYTYRALAHWRDHYLNIGEEQALPFKLDVNLNDLKEPLSQIGFADAINQQGYFEKWDAVTPLVKYILQWTEQDEKQFLQRINDMNYVVRLFKDHYHAVFISKAKAAFQLIDPARADEIALRLYFCLSQMVRFNQIFNKVEKFAGYGFNKSHAIAYSIVTYKGAYFKRRHTVAFYAAALTYKNLDSLNDTVTEAKSAFNIHLLTPHINLSQENFFPENEKNIRYGLGKLRDMGNFAPAIIQERNEQGHFTSLYDFMTRMTAAGKKPNVSVMASLSCTGAFDLFIPANIKKSPLNGRQFIFWMRELVANGPYISPEKGISLLHQQLSLLSAYEMGIYYLTHSKVAALKKAGFNHDAFALLPNAKQIKDVCNVDMLSVDDVDTFSRPIQAIIEKKENERSTFEQHYIALYKIFSRHQDQIIDFWQSVLVSACSSPIIDTLNQERHYSGMYITSDPLKVLRVADLASREPPGTYMNGYPIKIADIDTSFSDRRISTYGIVRNVLLKTVKKEDSPYYGEKLLIFTLEDGANIVSCMIFGTRATKQFHEKIVADGVIVLIGGEVSHNDFGLTISVEAIKRYFPTIDESLQVVPKMNKRR